MKIVWKVDSKPTGRYRSFASRAWPTAYYNSPDERAAAFLVCDDEYVPLRVREGKHSPLTIIMLHHQHPEAGNSWKRFRLKATAATLDEAKLLVEQFLAEHTDWHPKEIT